MRTQPFTIWYVDGRGRTQHIAQIRDAEGREHTRSRAILEAFAKAQECKLREVFADTNTMRNILGEVRGKILQAETIMLHVPITAEELKTAVFAGKRAKAPGIDGISHDFYCLAWTIIKEDLLEVMNEMYIEGAMLPSQTKGVVVYVPKTSDPETVTDYRALTLLNADAKLMARIIASRMKPLLKDVLHPSQYCGMASHNMLDAIAVIRDTVAEVEMTREPICILSLDFREAFDRVSHEYLYEVLATYGFDERFVSKIRLLYDAAVSTVQINGHLSRQIHLKRSIRQGCPLSMLLFNLCLDPFLRKMTAAIMAVRPVHQQNRTVVVAYADD